MSGTENLAAIKIALIQGAEAAGPTKGLAGSRAGEIARSADLGFRPQAYEAATLREFILKHVSELHVIGYSGLDPIYGLKAWSTAPSQTFGSLVLGSIDPWRVWVSPDSPVSLAISLNDGSVRGLSNGAECGPEEWRLSPLSREEHRQIARRFLEQLGTPPLEGLKAAVEDPDPAWWQKWLDVMRAQPASFASRWHRYRIDQLRAALAQALSKLPDAVAKRAFELISKRSAPEGRVLGQEDTAGRTRRLVHVVVDRMSREELRSLSLPLGLVLDAIGSKPELA